MRLLLVGPPGAGKGTQAARLAAWASVPHVSTGDMFRQAVGSGTALGEDVKGYLRRGALVPDAVTVAVVKERLGADDCRAGFVLDGFPRTLPQAEALDGLLEELGRPLDVAVALEVDTETVLRRLSGRRVCPTCAATYHMDDDPPAEGGRCRRCGQLVIQREDDAIETLRRRLAVFERETLPVLDYYAAQGKLTPVSGEGPVDAVSAALRDLLAGRVGA